MYSNVETFTPDKLFAGNEIPVLTEGITLVKSQGVLSRGSVVAIVTATGLAKLVDSTKTDGSEVPYGILTDDIDTTGADTKTTVYVSGYFNAEGLVFGGTDTTETHKRALRTSGIYLK